MMTIFPLLSKETEKFIDDWGFIPSPRPCNDDMGFLGWESWELNQVKRPDKRGNVQTYSPKDINRIWTVIEADCDCLFIIAGERYVNKIHYMVSTKPWRDKETQILDHACAACRAEEEE